MNAELMLVPDAAMVLGIVSTALPFARTPEDEAERWLRVLRLHGEVGAVLAGARGERGPAFGSGRGRRRRATRLR